MDGRCTPSALLAAVSLLAIGCEAVDDSEVRGASQEPRFGFMRDAARDALSRAGIDREVRRVMHLPMAIDRLSVTLVSHAPDVGDLSVQFWNFGEGWVLERPERSVIDAWLRESARE